MNKKIIYPILLAVLFAILISYPIAIFSSYIHEYSHMYQAKDEGVCLNLKEIRPFGGGKVEPCSIKDCEVFNSLSLESKRKITHAGVTANLALFMPLSLISSLLLLVFIKPLAKKDLFLVILIILLILVFLAIPISEIWGNVYTANPKADWNLINFTNCSLYP